MQAISLHWIVVILCFLLSINEEIAFLVSASIHPSRFPSPNINTSVCGKRIFTKNSGTIASPGYPERYPLNIICTYEIKVPNGFRIELKWDGFDIDGYMPNCEEKESDFVSIYLGCNEKKRHFTRFCNRNAGMPHALYSVDSCMSIELFTKPNPLAKTNRGFLAHYNAIAATHSPLPNQECNRTLSSKQGILHSTAWPNTYQSKYIDACYWHIKVEENMVVKFSVMDMDVPTTWWYYNKCNYCPQDSHDRLSVKGVGSSFMSSTNLRLFCGHCPPFTYTASYSELVITWKMAQSYDHNHRYNENRGFMLGYMAYQPVSKEFPVIWQVILVLFAALLSTLFCILPTCRRSYWLRRLKQRRARHINGGSHGGYRRVPNHDSDSEAEHLHHDGNHDEERQGCDGDDRNTILGDPRSDATTFDEQRRSNSNVAADGNSLVSYEGYPRSDDEACFPNSEVIDDNVLVHWSGPEQQTTENVEHYLGCDVPHHSDRSIESPSIDYSSISPSYRTWAPPTNENRSDNNSHLSSSAALHNVVRSFNHHGGEDSEQNEDRVVTYDLIDLNSVESNQEGEEDDCREMPLSPALDYDDIFQGLQNLISVTTNEILTVDENKKDFC
eukprot:gene7721-8560_t